MNKNVQMIITKDFTNFMKLIELGIIDKEAGCNAVINYGNIEYIYRFSLYIERANVEKLEDVIQSLSAKEAERNHLIELLEEQEYETIIENKEEYSKLFIEDNDDSMKRGRVLK